MFSLFFIYDCVIVVCVSLVLWRVFKSLTWPNVVHVRRVLVLFIVILCNVLNCMCVLLVSIRLNVAGWWPSCAFCAGNHWLCACDACASCYSLCRLWIWFIRGVALILNFICSDCLHVVNMRHGFSVAMIFNACSSWFFMCLRVMQYMWFHVVSVQRCMCWVRSIPLIRACFTALS